MARVRGVWVWLALAASLLVPVWFLVAAFGTKYGLIPWTLGYGVMASPHVAHPLLLGAAAFAFVALVLAFVVAPRRGRTAAAVAFLIPTLAIGYGMNLRQAEEAAAPALQASTDWSDPPGFSEAVHAARGRVPHGAALDIDPPSVERLRATQAALKPMITDTSTFDAFQVALDTAESQPGWVVDRNDPATGVIEAHATSFWFGFTDDIVIRVRRLPDASGTVIDMRAASRVDAHEGGGNAARVSAYMAALNASLGQAATGG